MEEIEKPSFENFLSKPGNLSDHLLWQLGAISVRPPVHQAAELIIGNLNEEGYLIASDEELLGIAPVAASRGRCGSGGQDRWRSGGARDCCRREPPEL